jgi:rhodanese-related sulfurtransferase
MSWRNKMVVDLVIVCVTVLIATALVKRIGDRRELERHTITPEELRVLLASSLDVLVVDVRQPLDLLGDSVIIPGAVWFAPRQVLDDPTLLPERRDLVVYCTCPSDKNSRAVLHRALAMGFSRIKFLEGGLDGWRAKGYPVEPYEQAFRLDSDQNRHLAAAS